MKWTVPGLGIRRSRNWLILVNFCLGILLCWLLALIPPISWAASRPTVPASPPSLSAQSNLLHEGAISYQAGRFSEAISAWQKAAQKFQEQGDTLYQALSLSYLCSAYQALGQWDQAQQVMQQSRNLLQVAASDPKQPLILAQVLNTQGSLTLALGDAKAALELWRQAEQTYATLQDEWGQLGSQINQVQALLVLGLYRDAGLILGPIRQRLQSYPDSALKLAALRSFGRVSQVIGNPRDAEKILQESLQISDRLNLPAEMSETLFSLANIARYLKQNQEALLRYQQAAEKAVSPIVRIEAQLNRLSLLIETQQWSVVEPLILQLQTQLEALSPSRMTVYARANLAEQAAQLLQYQALDHRRSNSLLLPAQLLAGAAQQARYLQDQRAESYALGLLGKLYEQNRQWQNAQQLTEQALLLAQAINAPDIIYRWQWQLGRILKAQSPKTGVSSEDQMAQRNRILAAYSASLNNLQSIKGDLLVGNPELQWSFQSRVEPIYRELLDLLIVPGSSQDDLRKAQMAIEQLRRAELETFFRSACLNSQVQSMGEIDAAATIIYPIILSDRLEVIIAPAQKPLLHYTTRVSQTELEQVVSKLLGTLNPATSNRQRLQLSQKLYDWLIRPAEPVLSQGTQTLVFVLDGNLRNLPMAVLHDGQQYLLEKYNLALTPSLEFLEPKTFQTEKPEALMLGLTVARQGFAALPGVAFETEQIKQQFPAQVFLDEKFTKQKLQNQLNTLSFTIVHIATHGQFSSDPEQTFLLTWNQKVSAHELQGILQSRNSQRPIDLVVLSACQTALGDQQATLGLAGLAVQSGARSTLATLWAVDDRSTALLMTEFYKHLRQKQVPNKAESLRAAQLALMKVPEYRHPFFWAPFVLVGNWL